MTRQKKTIHTITLNADRLQDAIDILEKATGRPYRIREATMKEGVCHYSYEITSGVGIGDTHSVKGSALFKSDLMDAFTKFNVHLAFVDDAFKLKEIEVKNIDDLHGHDLAFLYTVTGFKIKGAEESESIILIGSKFVSTGSISLESPRIPLDNYSSYKWYNELKAAADAVREEVALYKEGKSEPVEVVDDKADPKQNKIPFGTGDARDTLDPDFAKASV